MDVDASGASTAEAPPALPPCGASQPPRLFYAQRPRPQDHNPRQWLELFRKAGDGTDRPDMWEIRRLRQVIWGQTEKWIGKTPHFDQTECVSSDGSQTLVDEDASASERRDALEVQVLQRDLLEQARELVERQYRVAVLNMASPHTPGGGVKAGAGAQEETMFRRSDLKNFLDPTQYPLKATQCLVSRDVTILRGPRARGLSLLGARFLSCDVPDVRRPAASEAHGRLEVSATRGESDAIEDSSFASRRHVCPVRCMCIFGLWMWGFWESSRGGGKTVQRRAGQNSPKASDLLHFE